MSSAPRASAVSADVEAWLTELGLEPLERAEREGVTSWDIVLDGRRRAALRITLILDPTLALICWAHYAPPINDSFRRSYRTLLRWNDELPFLKFAIGEDERPILVAELPVAALDRDELGLAIARQLDVADRHHEASVAWLKAGGWRTAPVEAGAEGPGTRLLARYEDELRELLAPGGAVDETDGETAVGAGAPGVAPGRLA